MQEDIAPVDVQEVVALLVATRDANIGALKRCLNFI
jgi:hypothetical protein